MDTSTSSAALIAAGRRAVEIESRAVAQLLPRIGAEFVRASQLCLAATGRVVVSGLGKSGHIGHKIAATLASTGTPSFFLHAAEASHGDLGMVQRGDVLLAVSNSGETPELLALLPPLRRLAVPVIALTGHAKSTLARESTVHLDVAVAEEACPLNLAPTASTTATLAMGDALATALLEARGFTSEDFARAHPGGALGRKLLLHVADVMRRGDDLPVVPGTATLEEGLVEMSRKGLGMTAVTDAAGALAGVFTDGDLRRALDRGVDLRGTTMEKAMTRNPRHIGPHELAAEAVNRMQEHRITALLVVDGGRLAGALNIHDLLRAGVV
jgi:arabinose-5-phosphate isomerase